MSDTTGTQGESLHISPEELDQLRQHVSDDGEAVEQEILLKNEPKIVLAEIRSACAIQFL